MKVNKKKMKCVIVPAISWIWTKRSFLSLEYIGSREEEVKGCEKDCAWHVFHYLSTGYGYTPRGLG